MDIIEELYGVVDVLAANEVNYAICGGLAVAIHGRPRMTVDIDLLVSATRIEEAAKAAAEAGFDDVTGWINLPKTNIGVERLYRVNKIQGEGFLTLDLLEFPAGSGNILDDIEIFELGERQLKVLSKPSLIRMKEGTGRTQDQLDVELLTDDIA